MRLSRRGEGRVSETARGRGFSSERRERLWREIGSERGRGKLDEMLEMWRYGKERIEDS